MGRVELNSIEFRGAAALSVSGESHAVVNSPDPIVKETLIIAGPTGSGKSEIAMEVARRCQGEIVNADAFQLYQGMDVLTANPSESDRRSVPHHLYGIVPLSNEMDAATFSQRALRCVQEILDRGVLPILVGGSGLYIKSLTHGLSPLPSASIELRQFLQQLTLAGQADWLSRLDTSGVHDMDLQNPRYVERALEITLLTGIPASTLKKQWASFVPEFRGVCLEWNREDLYDRINARTWKMVESGLVDEVKQLKELSETASKAIGISEIRDHLSGKCSLEKAVEAMQQATRRYAKRQMTWFRREKGFQTVCIRKGDSAKSTAERILERFPEITA